MTAPCHPFGHRPPDAAGWLFLCPVWFWHDDVDEGNCFLHPRFGLPDWAVDVAAVPFVLFGVVFKVSGLRPLTERELRSWSKRLRKERG